MTTAPQGFEFSSDDDRMDRARIHAWLSTEAYWALGRSRSVQDAAIDGSRNFGVFRTSGEQVAYARVVTDGVTFGWVCDVFVDQAVRGVGVGRALVSGMTAELDAMQLKRVLLKTGDAHGLYREFGFVDLEDPHPWMLRTPPG